MRANPAAHPAVAGGSAPDDDADVDVVSTYNPVTARGQRPGARIAGGIAFT